MHNKIYLLPDKTRKEFLLKLLNQFKLLQTLNKKCYVDSNFSTTNSSISNLEQETEVEQIIHDIISSNLLKAEKSCPGSSEVLINTLISMIEQQEKVNLKQEIKHIISSSSKATFTELKEIISGNIEPRFMRFLSEAINLSGIDGRIFMEPCENNILSAELMNGYIFQVNTPLNKTFRCKSVKTLVIDGYAENVSEVHHIFERSSETMQPLLLVCRGMGNDITNTISVNNLRGTFTIIPVISMLDVSCANTLNDIAVTCLADLVTSSRGQLISCVNYDSLSVVQEVRCSPGSLTIINNNSLPATKVQISKILQSREAAAHDVLATAYDARLRALTPSQTRFQIPDGSNYVEMTEAVDKALRLSRNVIQFGVFRSDRSGELCKSLKNSLTKNIPTISAIRGVMLAVSTLKLLENVGCVIV
jgi:hypothetical protein